MAAAEMGELELIERIRGGVGAKNPAVRVGIGDDCAVLRMSPGAELLVTTDLCLEGRHFRRDWHSAQSAGHRCLARGLSDVAAMGGRPVAAFLSLALPRGFDQAWFDGFMDGLQGLAQEHGVELAGGDTAQAAGAEIVADVTLLGMAVRGKAMRRAGARVGDGIFVTGTLGGAAAELAAISAGQPWLREVFPQTFPEPRLSVGRELAKRGFATACLDVSDGLSTDLRHLCTASRVRAELDLERMPVAAGATLDQALHGGEDYELLFTAMAGVRLPAMIAAVPVTRIGTIVGGEGPLVQVAGGEELPRGGWEHFSAERFRG